MKEEKDLFDWKHIKLWRMSFIADFLSFVAILIFVLLALAELYNHNQTAQSQFQTNLIGMVSQNLYSFWTHYYE